MPTAKARRSNHIDRQTSSRRIRWALVACAAVLMFIIIDIFTPLGGGQIKYYKKWIDCGRQPLETKGIIGNGLEYYQLAPTFDLLRDNHIKYFCTPKEAEKAGYSSHKNYYSYPHLTQDELNYLHAHGPIEP